MLEILLDIIFPPCCTICGKIEKKWICSKCILKIKQELKYRKINRHGKKIYFIAFYEKQIKKLLLNFKFDDKPYLSKMFAELIIRNAKLYNNIIRYDYIIPVPMYKSKERQRGYNHSKLLAGEISKKTKVKFLDNALIKIKDNKRQSLLALEERKSNVQNAYKVANNKDLKNKKILLIDDIYTTGNTANECCRELKKCKPKRIDILVIAKTKYGKLD